jgi:hypothetical protein
MNRSISRSLTLMLLVSLSYGGPAWAQQGRPTRESCAFYENAARNLADPTLRMPARSCLDLSVKEWKDVVERRKPADPVLGRPAAPAPFEACKTLSFTGLCRRAAAAERLYVWAGDGDFADSDFLAVFDADPASPGYGSLIATTAVEGRANVPHHTEYELSGRTLLASGWGKGRTFVFDLSTPDSPTVLKDFTVRGDYGYPHSYARLPNGNVLAVFQAHGNAYAPPGALVELGPDGELIRASSAATADIPAAEIWPYSLLVLPDIDRVVTTNTRMGVLEEWMAAAEAAKSGHAHEMKDPESTHIQLWKLSTLELLASFPLPAQQGGHNVWPAEPRRLDNGDVYVNTFTCGLYRLEGLTGGSPRALAVASSDFPRGETPCAVPVVIGKYWIQPEHERAIVVYDLSDRARARVASRLVLDERFAAPHWLAADQASARVAATSESGWLLVLKLDRETGSLAVDEAFRDPGADRPGVSFLRKSWPHGDGGDARPHGAVFGRR